MLLNVVHYNNPSFCLRSQSQSGLGSPRRTLVQMFYYVGSKLAFQWTAQHGCGGNENTRCEVGAHVYTRIRPLIVVRVPSRSGPT